MRLRLWWMIPAIFLSLVSSPCLWAQEPQTIESLISPSTRLIVFSPHPDDESLGTGGLIQRVVHAGGSVKVVFMTSGDGYTEGVEKEDHTLHPTPIDYRRYGKEREKEALGALAELGLKKRGVSFLGFPDGGLTSLLQRYRFGSKTYTSPYTLEKHPPLSDIIIPHTGYNDQDLRKEIVRLLLHFRPTLVATTSADDQHPDHCSTYYLVQESLRDLLKKDPSAKPKVITFVIHFGSWPVGDESGPQSRLEPPQGFPDKNAKWVSFALRPEEIEVKRKALLQYRSQVPVLGWFIPSFVRSNELFILTP